jgi:hypothetical protein
MGAGREYWLRGARTTGDVEAEPTSVVLTTQATMLQKDATVGPLTPPIMERTYYDMSTFHMARPPLVKARPARGVIRWS